VHLRANLEAVHGMPDQTIQDGGLYRFKPPWSVDVANWRRGTKDDKNNSA
jgi:hypothetical protein